MVHVETTQVGSESALSQIVQLVGKFHKYPKSWIPPSMDIFELALQFGISAIVIACPCVLALQLLLLLWVLCNSPFGLKS